MGALAAAWGCVEVDALGHEGAAEFVLAEATDHLTSLDLP
jgi:hypothetical protein